MIEVVRVPGGLHGRSSSGGQEGRCDRARFALPAGTRRDRAHYPGRLDIMEGDALKVDFESNLPTARCASSPIYLQRRHTGFSSIAAARALAALLAIPDTDVPARVGLRIVAGADDDHYGRLGVALRWRTKAVWHSTSAAGLHTAAQSDVDGRPISSLSKLRCPCSPAGPGEVTQQPSANGARCSARA
ncbi:hypothetical protein F2981_11705 [Sinorhizobium meliloti]|nr:hypothetical protein [Sinorhizobium meliloti]